MTRFDPAGRDPFLNDAWMRRMCSAPVPGNVFDEAIEASIIADASELLYGILTKEATNTERTAAT